MRLLIDECIDRRFAKELKNYDVKTVAQMGWAGIKNGKLLTLAEKRFDAFISVDRNLSFQQNLPEFHIAILILRAKTNRLADLKTLVPKLLNTLPQAKPQRVTIISSHT